MKTMTDGAKVARVHRVTRNPWKMARSVWRIVRHLGPVEDGLQLEHMFKQSRFAGWEQIAKDLMPDVTTAADLLALPRWPVIDLEALERDCPEGSLGAVFTAHMKYHGLNPNLFEAPPCLSREDYVFVHMTETHDLWHVLTGFGTDLAGEIAVFAFITAQVRTPLTTMVLAVMLINTAFFAHSEIEMRFAAMVEGWQAGKRARQLFGVDWDQHLNRPIEDVRREFAPPQAVEAGPGIYRRAA